MKTYTVKQASEVLNVSTRAIQKKCLKDNIRKKNNKYLIKQADIDRWIKTNERTNEPNTIREIIKEIDNDDYVLIVLNAIRENKHLEEFTPEEYEQFKDRLKEANFLEQRISEYKKEIERMEEYVKDYRNNIEYLKKSLDKRADETEVLLKSLHQRNYIEAKEKGFDKD